MVVLKAVLNYGNPDPMAEVKSEDIPELAHLVLGVSDLRQDRYLLDEKSYGERAALLADTFRNMALNHIEATGNLVARSWIWWSRLAPLTQLNGRTLAAWFSEVTGVNFQHFLAITFANFTHFASIQSANALDTKEFILDLEKWLESTALEPETVDLWHSQLTRGLDDYPTEEVEDATFFTNFVAFDESPLVKIPEKGLVAISSRRLMRRSCEGIYWILHRHFRQKGREAIQGYTRAFGGIFQEYARLY